MNSARTIPTANYFDLKKWSGWSGLAVVVGAVVLCGHTASRLILLRLWVRTP